MWLLSRDKEVSEKFPLRLSFNFLFLNRNVCICDTLLPSHSTKVAECKEIGTPLTSIVYDSNKKSVIVGDTEGGIYVLDTRKFSMVMCHKKEHTDEVTSLSIDPHYNLLFSSSMDGLVKIWSTNLEIEHSFKGCDGAAVSKLHLMKTYPSPGQLNLFAAGHDGSLVEHIVQLYKSF